MVTARSALLLAVSLGAAATSVPRFADVADRAGLTDIFYCGSDTAKNYILETLGGGVALIDYDNDGWLDAFFVTGSRMEGYPEGKAPVNHLYRNRHDGTFERVTAQAGLAASGWGQGVCAADYDNDGNTDLFVTYYGTNRLYRNEGGRFRDVSRQAGLSPETRWSTGCAFFDYDRDGLADLFVANYIVFDRASIPLPGKSPNCNWRGIAVLCGPQGLPPGVNQLLHNEGDGRFRDVSADSGIAKQRDRYSLSATPLDYDNDGWPDLYVAVDSRASLLYRNNRDGTFTDVAVQAGVAYREDGHEQSGMGSAAGDFDGDGQLDLVKTNFIDDTPNLYRNLGDGSFEDHVHPSGLGQQTKYMGWGVGFLDYDNDGRPDIFMVNGHVYPEIEAKAPGQPYRQARLLYRNLDGKRFEQVRSEAIAEPHSGRGLAFGDFDNDGDVDIFVSNMNERPSLLANGGAGSNHWISLRLIGVKSNRSALGARVTVHSGGRQQVQEVRSGSTYLSQSDLRLHFGLGSAARIERIAIRWPVADSVQTLVDVGADQILTITEGK